MKFSFRPYYFVVCPTSLEFAVPNLEPFFCTLTLFQMNSNTKEVQQISEKFHFHLNSPVLLGKLEQHFVCIGFLFFLCFY